MARVLTHQMTGAPTGDRIDMGGICRRLKITARAACWVRAPLMRSDAAAPEAPAATPAPANGAEAPDGWVYLAANDVFETTADPYSLDGYRYVLLWELAPGLVTAEEI